MPTMRARFIRRRMFEHLRQGDFNRIHYSEAEAFCWWASAADCLHALGGMAGNWQSAIDEPRN